MAHFHGAITGTHLHGDGSVPSAGTPVTFAAVLQPLEWSGAAVFPTPPAVQFDAALQALAWSGAVDSPTPPAVQFAASLAAQEWSGTAVLSGGTLTSRAFHSGAVLPLVSGSIPYVQVSQLDLSSPQRYTAQSYDASGFWTRTDVAFTVGQSYLVLYSNGAGTFGAEVLTAV